jgi:hypothetical protein
MYAHYVARARRGLAPLFIDETARWLWERLRAEFPEALAALLMPDHIHLIAKLSRGRRRTLAAILGALARYFDLGQVWERVPEPQPLPSIDKLRRSVRYDLLNPCRPWKFGGNSIRLVRDPLSWPWSTLRDVIGAAVDPWTPCERLEAALDWRSPDFARSFQAYVSSDPTVHVKGTAFPVAASSRAVPIEPLARIGHAVISATRQPTDALKRSGPTRTLFVGLAYHQGWSRPELVAGACGAHRNTVTRLAHSCSESMLSPAALCLGDARLMISSLDPIRHAVEREMGRQGAYLFAPAW